MHMRYFKAFYTYDGDVNDGGLHVEIITSVKKSHAVIIAKELELSIPTLKFLGLRETIAATRWK